ncbi:uncharacterized protein LOC113279564 [Papaver somniferum]|uniref:uncharacterized protein LOC113279564 n=1 Tax=Papaver somniferum TaxID=3469 RepID=UPI000E6F8C27|nr:uncharacterized protein LOC113279564 [Papaver somniferum]
MGENMNLPWVIIGDFNSTLYSHERQSYSIHPTQSHPIITNTISELGLIDIPFTGSPFTWSNHRDQLNQVRTRLDRALCLPSWMTIFPNEILNNLIPCGSDHAPILLNTNPQNESLSKPFRFYEHWLTNSTCKEEIKKNWVCSKKGTEAFKVTNKLRRVKNGLKIWRIKEYGDTDTKIKEVQEQLQVIINQPQINMEDHQRCQQQVKSLYEVKNRIAYQQSRESTIRYQERNSKIFHAQANYRRRTNQIHSLKSVDGEWKNTRAEITQILLEHFQEITTTSNPEKNDEIMNLISPCITAEENNKLTAVPTSQEIRKVCSK